MTSQWSVPAWVLLATLVVLGAVVIALAAALRLALRRHRAATTALVEASARDTVALAERVEALERRRFTSTAHEETEYVVTTLGLERPQEPATPAPVVPAPLFADLVLREGVVQAASLAAGLRRALAPEMRHRIRFEMRREVKRARKQRRADLRQARREFEDRQRAAA